MSVPLDASLNARSLLPVHSAMQHQAFGDLSWFNPRAALAEPTYVLQTFQFQTIDPSDVYSMHGYINYSLNRQVYVVTS